MPRGRKNAAFSQITAVTLFFKNLSSHSVLSIAMKIYQKIMVISGLFFTFLCYNGGNVTKYFNQAEGFHAKEGQRKKVQKKG
jgi:hypothetical protein